MIQEEAARNLRLRILLLESENDELHTQLALGDDRIDTLEQDMEELRGQLSYAEEEARRQEGELRVQDRDLSNLKVCSHTGWGCAFSPSVERLESRMVLHRDLEPDELVLAIIDRSWLFPGSYTTAFQDAQSSQLVQGLHYTG